MLLKMDFPVGVLLQNLGNILFEIHCDNSFSKCCDHYLGRKDNLALIPIRIVWYIKPVFINNYNFSEKFR